MIEVRTVTTKIRSGSVEIAHLVLDGSLVEQEMAMVKVLDGPFCQVRVNDRVVWERFCAHRFLEIPDSIPEVFAEQRLGEITCLLSIHKPFTTRVSTSEIAVTCTPKLDLYRWNRPWTPEEFISEYTIQVNALAGLGLRFRSRKGRGDQLEVRFPSPSPPDLISELFAQWLPVMSEILHSTVRTLDAHSSTGSLVMRFEFPPQVQGACEQYLTFFAQFLREFEVEVDTSLQHEGTAALFAVTPREKDQALDQIWRALSLYLHLPKAPRMDIANVHTEDRQVLKMAAMVQSYSAQLAWARSEMSAAQAELRAQAREIQLMERENEGHLRAIADQRALLEQQARALESANVLMESIRSIQVDGKEVNKEELLGGLVTLGTMEEKGIGINWALGFRKLRGLLGSKGGDNTERGGG